MTTELNTELPPAADKTQPIVRRRCDQRITENSIFLHCDQFGPCFFVLEHEGKRGVLFVELRGRPDEYKQMGIADTVAEAIRCAEAHNWAIKDSALPEN